MAGSHQFSRFFPWFSPRGALLVALLFVASNGVFGCGKKATADDCERILVRMAELELAANHVSDPQQVAQQVAATKNTFRERTFKECVGRQISKSAMDCVGRAKTTDEILGECLD
jgi:hypothetical protein